MRETIGDLVVGGLAGLTAFALTFLLTPLVRMAAVRYGWVGKPTEDRWGHRTIGRLGGVAMFAGFLTATLMWVPAVHRPAGLLISLGLVFGLGLLDDFHRLPPYTKLVAQLLIGCAVVSSGIHIDLFRWAWVSIPCSVLWFVLVMNAFNLLDNMDGLAAGIGALAAGFCALHAGMAGQWHVVTLSLILGGACLGFLRFNFPPAKIYMGDSGSHFLGLSLAALALLGSWRHSTQLLSVLAVPALVLAVPIFDTCFVTIQRMSHHQHPFVGGTDHVSHRLAILGLSSRQTVLALYGVSACLGALSIASIRLAPLPAVLVMVLVLTALTLFGSYLARVNVYRLEKRPADEESATEFGRHVTLVNTMLLYKRRLVEIVVDFCLVSSAYVGAFLLRFDGQLSPDLQRLILQSLPIILVVKVACFAGCRLYQGVWRYVSLTDLINVVRAATIGSVLSTLALLFLWRFQGYSRAVLVIDWMLCLLAVGGSRIAERLLDEWIHGLAERETPVLIIGAGDTGDLVLRSLKHEGAGGRRVIGFLDDDFTKQGSRLHGVPVMGGREQLPGLLEQYEIREVLIAIGDPPGELLQYVQRCCESRGTLWKVVTAGVMHAA